MADQQDYEKLLPKLNAIGKKDVRYPDMPVDQAVKEAEIMAAAAEEDTQKLSSVGLDAARVPELAAAVGSLRFAQARLTAAMGEVKAAAKLWAEEEPKALDLRFEILAAVTFAFRKVPDAVKAIKKIREGSGGADMIQDLLALSELGKKYPAQLQAIKFDAKLLDSASEKADSLGKLYAKAFVEKSTATSKDARDRAFTYMRMLMGEILDAAEYVFRKDQQRLDYYYSAYRSRRTAATGPVPVPEAAA